MGFGKAVPADRFEPLLAFAGPTTPLVAIFVAWRRGGKEETYFRVCTPNQPGSLFDVATPFRRHGRPGCPSISPVLDFQAWRRPIEPLVRACSVSEGYQRPLVTRRARSRADRPGVESGTAGPRPRLGRRLAWFPPAPQFVPEGTQAP